MSIVYTVNEVEGKLEKVPRSIDEVLLEFSENSIIPIGNRLGISYVRSQEESLEIKIGSHQIHLQQSNVGMMGISTVIWDAGLLLIDFLHTIYVDKPDFLSTISPGNIQADLGHILDLGCGTGISGLACYIFGAKSATLSDLQLTGVLRDNIEEIKKFPLTRVEGTIDFIQYDWKNELIPVNLINPQNTSNSTWDTIICSDVLYEHKNHNSFMRLLKSLKFNKLILSYKCRHVKEESGFLKELSTWCSLYFIQNSIINMQNIKDSSCAGLMIIVCAPLI